MKLVFFFFKFLYLCAHAYKDDAQEVIENIHAEADENHDGEIDLSEATHFAYRDDNYINADSRKDIFIKSLTKDNLWKLWKFSDTYNWSTDVVLLWLQYEVGLPQYINAFIVNNINGTYYPRLALSDFSYLNKFLKIQDISHCQKIAFKAKNIILFGPSKEFLRRFPPKDLVSYNIISNLHSQLDDDKDGGVDPNEADEFVRDELKYTSDFDRAKTFNKDDNHISKEELWLNWKSSSVYNWTVDDVVNWLCNHVELCEYAPIFKVFFVDGSMIPRLAQSDMSYLFKDLKIRNAVHRKKIIVKATDLILFGPPKSYYSRTKDSILITLILIAVGGCWLAYSQRRYSKSQIVTLQQKLKQLNNAESSLIKLQDKLNEAEKRNDEVSQEKQEMEEKLKTELEKKELFHVDSSDDLKSIACSDPQHYQYERILNMSTPSDISWPDQLKLLLQITYEVEGSFFELKRLDALRQMETTKELCEKIRKKKSAIMGSIRIAHSNYFEEMEQQISDSKCAIEQIKSDLMERSERWKKIEQLTNFNLIPTPGLVKLRSELNNSFLETGTITSTGTILSSNASVSHISATASAVATANANNNVNNIRILPQQPTTHKESNLQVSTNIRPKSLLLFQAGDIPSPIETTISNNAIVNDNKLPKVWSVSNNLAHLYTSTSPCCAFHDVTTTTNGVGSSGFVNNCSQQFALVPFEQQQQQQLGCNNKKINDKVRPFAFRWLKKSKK